MKALILVLALLMATSAYGQIDQTGEMAKSKVETRSQASSNDQITLSASLLTALASKGLLQIQTDAVAVYGYIEPKYWQSLTHLRKQQTTQALMNVTRSDNKGQELVKILDMTSHETLARGILKDSSITIYK